MHIRSGATTTYRLFLFAVLSIILIYILTGLYSDIVSGGHGWRQGDWLINNEHEFVRRGISGSIIFGVSDYFSVNPLVVLGLSQAIVIVSVFSILALSLARLGPNIRILWLALSPAFLFMFMFLDLDNGLKKEIIVYFSYSLIVVYTVTKLNNKAILWLSSLVFVFGVFSHEGNIFFLPFFMILLYLVKQGSANEHWYLLILFVVMGSLGGLGYAIAFPKSPDPNVICSALLQRGLSENLCNGAISYLDHDMSRAVDFVKFQLLDSGLYKSYLAAYLLSLMPLLFLRPANIPMTIYLVAITSGIILFFPLFILAYDWGRWINFYITSVTIILLIHMNLRPDLYPLNVDNTAGLKLFFLFYFIFWNMPHCCGQIGFGVVNLFSRLVNEMLVAA